MRYTSLTYSVMGSSSMLNTGKDLLIQSAGLPQGTEDKVRKVEGITKDIDEKNGIKIVESFHTRYLLIPEDNPVFNIAIILRAIGKLKLDYSLNFSVRKAGSKIITKMLDGSSILP